MAKAAVQKRCPQDAVETTHGSRDDSVHVEAEVEVGDRPVDDLESPHETNEGDERPEAGAQHRAQARTARGDISHQDNSSYGKRRRIAAVVLGPRWVAEL